LEPAYIDQVRLLGTDAKTGKPTRASIKLRFNRNPVVGDKFSSRHGQKGVLSVLWPQQVRGEGFVFVFDVLHCQVLIFLFGWTVPQDMPFSESGMSPDVIINPHAFPSRMTIGMLVESMAGKVGSMQGQFQDATPFRFSERQPIVSHLGQQLVQAGYSYYGSEPMYSGTDGNEVRRLWFRVFVFCQTRSFLRVSCCKRVQLHADIFLGVVYYQRLRHMVSDKSQVRSTGPIHALTRQPVKGRKRHGGIRFGEMERWVTPCACCFVVRVSLHWGLLCSQSRDSLLAHGTAFLLRDRLFNCSDKHVAWMCKQCGSVLSTVTHLETGLGTAGKSAAVASAEAVVHRKPFCHVCERSDTVTSILLPYVFRYLANELAAMSIRLTLEVGGV
jgi:DNA-directed RNA polymerase I subunit RPA2